MKFESITFDGHYIRLVPFDDNYAIPLAATGNPQMMYYTYGPREWTPDGIRMYISQRFSNLSKRVPLLIVKQITNEIIGFAAFINIDESNNRLEIGPIWITEEEQGSPAFTESMYMMLKHAFEVAGVRRVAFTCDSSNIRSKSALLKIGATIEGALRKDLLRTDKSVRNTLLFGIVDTDWPDVRETLQIYLYPECYSHLLEIDHVNIRPSRLDDLIQIADLEKKVFGQGYPFSNIRQYYDLFCDLLYVAETKDAGIIGYVLGGITTRDSQVGCILSIGVRRGYRGKGIGRRLMSTINMQLRSRNCREIMLTVHPNMEHVIHFYEKIGYTKQQLLPDYCGPDSPRYVMRLLCKEPLIKEPTDLRKSSPSEGLIQKLDY